MSASSLALSLVLRLNNQLSGPMGQATRAFQAGTRAMAAGARAAANETRRLAGEAGRAGAGVNRLAAEARRVSGAGIARAAAEAQRLGRAARAAAAETRRLGQEAGRAAANAGRAAVRGGAPAARGAAAGAAGAVAGGMVVGHFAKLPMDYDRRLALLSNTANNDKDVPTRIAGKRNLDANIRNALRLGGGTTDSALDAYQNLVGSGAFGNANDVAGILPTLMKAGTGTGAETSDLAQIMVAAKQNLGLSKDDMQAVLSKSIKGGQLGGFELNDMARYLPAQMADFGAKGNKGQPALDSLIAANQVSRITAGTGEAAGINLHNLLAKLNSQDTANDFKKKGIDLSGSLAAAAGKGQNSLEAFVGMVDGIANKDKKYTDLRNKANQEKDGTKRKAIYESMADILHQSSVGQVVQDRQAMGALVAMMEQKETYQRIKKAVAEESGSELDKSYVTVADTLSAKTEQLENKKQFAAIDTLVAIEKPLSDLLVGTNDLAEKYPGLSASLYAATVAVGTFTAAVSIAAAANGGGVRGALSAAGSVLKYAGAPAIAAAGGYAAGSLVYDHLNNDQKDVIGGTMATIMANFGSKEAEQALNVNLYVDGRQLQTVVNTKNSTDARRH